MADEFVLIHKSWTNEPVHEPVHDPGVQKDISKKSPTCFSGFSGQVSKGASERDVCNYYREVGHWKLAVGERNLLTRPPVFQVLKFCRMNVYPLL